MIRFHPYRRSADKPDAGADVARDWRELVLPFGILWVISLARVVAVVASHGVFGVADTLALVFLVGLPSLLIWQR